MTKLEKIVKAYFKKIKEDRPKNVWFNRSKNTENGWINETIQLKDVATTDADWFVNMFVKDQDNSDEEFQMVVKELAKNKMYLVEETLQACKNKVSRYLIDRGLPTPATATAEESPF